MTLGYTGSSFLQLGTIIDRTSESGRRGVARPIGEDLYLGALAEALPSELERAFDVALANGREHAWEKFIDLTCDIVPRMTATDVEWLLRALTEHQGLRATAALVQVLGQIAEQRPDCRTTCRRAFERLARHPSPEIRLLVVEWAPELGPEFSRKIAHALAGDPHPAVQQALRSLQPR